MVQIEDIARAALGGEALRVRSLVQDFLAENDNFADVAKPSVSDARIVATAASLLELFASRTNTAPPAWTRSVAALDEPCYLVRSAETMPRLRELCERESPEPLRRRRLYAPPGYLTAA